MSLVVGCARFGGHVGAVIVKNCLAADNVLRTVDPHGLKAGDVVVFGLPSKVNMTWPIGGTGGFSEGVQYHVLADGIKTREFKLSTSAGGSVVDFASNITAAFVFPLAANVEARDACTLAAYDGLSASVASKAGVTDTISVTGEDDTELLTAGSAHGLSNTNRIIFITREGGSNIRIGKTYYVRDVSGLTFKLALTSGGAALDLGSDITAGTFKKVPLTNLTTYHPRFMTVWVDTGGSGAHEPRGELSENILVDIGLRGAVPMIYWQATGAAATLSTIIAGDHNAHIDAIASRILAYGAPVMLRWCQEMAESWWPWSAGVNGNTATIYRNAWKAVRNRVRATTTLGKFVWTPLHGFESSMESRYNKWEPYWPNKDGGSHVDYVGFDFYQWPINIKTRKLVEGSYSGNASTNDSDRLTFWDKNLSNGTKVPGRHRMSIGQAFTFLSVTQTGTANIVAGDRYYVIADGFSLSAFKFSTTKGGSAFNFGSDVTVATVRAQESMDEQIKQAIWALRKLQGKTSPSTQPGSIGIIIGELGHFGKTEFTVQYRTATYQATGSEFPSDWEEEPAATLASTDVDNDLVFRRSWFKAGFNALAANYTDLVGICYFDYEMDLNSKHPNWRFDAEPGVLGTVSVLLNKSTFRRTIS